jgi:hypothetical protein
VRLEKEADLVVAGVMATTVEDGRGQAELLGRSVEVDFRSGVISVGRWLKGNDGSSELRVRLISLVGRGYDFVVPGTYRLFFLKRVGSQLEFVDHDNPTLPALAGVTVSGDTALERVSGVALGLLSSRQASSRDRLEAIAAVTSLEAPAVIPGLRALVNDPDERVRLTAVAGLIQKDDLSVLPVVEKVLMTSVSARSEVEKSLALTFRGAIARYVHDAAAVPTLRRLLASSDVETRRKATEARSVIR